MNRLLCINPPNYVVQEGWKNVKASKYLMQFVFKRNLGGDNTKRSSLAGCGCRVSPQPMGTLQRGWTKNSKENSYFLFVIVGKARYFDKYV